MRPLNAQIGNKAALYPCNRVNVRANVHISKSVTHIPNNRECQPHRADSDPEGMTMLSNSRKSLAGLGMIAAAALLAGCAGGPESPSGEGEDAAATITF